MEAAAGTHTERCSFCKKPRAQVRFLVAGPAVSICEECVQLAAGVIVEKRGGTLPPVDAKCARHPEEAAVLVCPRCGAFACSLCTSPSGAPLCTACLARVAPPPVVATPPLAPARWRAHPAFFVCTGIVVGVLLVYLILGLS